MIGKKKTLKNPLILALAFLVAPISYSFIAATINQERGPIDVPGWIGFARIITVAISIATIVFLCIFDRRTREKAASKTKNEGIDLEVKSLFWGQGVSLSPTIAAFINFLLGAPVVDVYACSAFSLLAFGIWLWRRRAVLSAGIPKVVYKPSLEGQPAQMIPLKTGQAVPIHSYTVVLSLLGVFGVLGIIYEIFLMSDSLRISKPPTFLITISFYVIITLGCWIVAFLRLRRSPYALYATRTISIVLLFFFPFGTAAFVYWRWRVRKRENQTKLND
ncbi:MAG: hypothetical protein HXY44_17990 [Syntrophaceae bacterium]|nr:hypothetical protein [Syntrophaceae bacterium]